MPAVEWDVAEDLVCFHLGRSPAGNDETPVEPIADGCPGGDQRSPLVASLWPWYRRRDGQGGRVASPMLDHAPPHELALRALAYYEQEQDACSAYAMRQASKAQERRNRGT